MVLQWLLTGASLVAALVAWRRARRTATRLDELSQMYWELKYQHGALRVELQRLTGEAPPAQPPAPPREPSGGGFVPIAALKRDRT